MQDLREFDSGADYDAQYDKLYEPEIKTLSKAASECGGAVLDIGCGTGIVTIPVAENNPDTQVVGFDISKAMLAQAKLKTKEKNLNNLSFHEADAVHFDLFDLNLDFKLAFMTGNVFQGFMTEKDVKQVLKNIHDHLAPKAKFYFDTRLLENFDFSKQADFELASSYIDAKGRNVNYYMKRIKHDVQNDISYIEKKRIYEDGQEVFSGIDLKFFPYDYLIALIEDCGFKFAGQYSNWSLDEFDSDGTGVVLELSN